MRVFLTLVLMVGLVSPAAAFDSLEDLGEALFFDVNLSKNRTQSCATCHDPDYGFVDPRETDAGRAVSLGDDGESLGDRSAPTAAYAKFTPEFEQLDKKAWRGGMFWDGRAAGLAGQAGGPPLNPIEMGMPDEASVVARLSENADYVTSFISLFGDAIWDDDSATYDAMTQAIASFERTDFFSPFDSKYDRFLRGEAELTDQEELGRVLFFSEQFTNCNLCHQLRPSPIAEDETFTNYEYHNIGTPVNADVRAANGVEGPDLGLLANPAIDTADAGGRYKVPTLRNVAVTGPYMHNGVFKDLRTVVLFYNKYNTLDKDRQINPETGKPWVMPEIPQNLAVTELIHGPALDDKRIDALVAFMKALTDARYEHLLEE
ncbi:Cytochrome c peroxidase [Aliiroseovarius sediminilitoris]|uniref:Cytochrome c peroxidase n=1 Tax=Aliiroseovarius sediminilitoris TaxID=1173584 RepID=A0A1I0NK04_9RHOB|nr:cytochrome c peroxidase [Aliiroseovarius sediminilitoris]SEW01558.1 Cytochrome c peroxidase [Aliiroseovarius sediminilitoris]